MLEQTNIRDLLAKIDSLKREVTSLKKTEADLRKIVEAYEAEYEASKTKGKTNRSNSGIDDDEFLLLTEDDIKFSIADKKIEILEAYEYYLSESSPLYNLINQAINAFPVLEWVLEEFIKELLGVMEENFTKKEILEHSIQIFQSELDRWDQ